LDDVKNYSWVAVLLVLAAVFPMPNFSVLASTETETSVVPSVSAAGRGWFVFNGFRNNFGFALQNGKLSEASGWRYVPKGYLVFAVFDFEGNKIFDLRSVIVWRFRIEEIEGGFNAVISGMANVYTSKGVLENWWFRAEARDIEDSKKSVDGFAISVWRPGGADKMGCW